MRDHKLHGVLLVGGAGVVGARTARTLRAAHPDLPLVIAGRDLARARTLAADLGRAHAVAVDLARPDIGIDGQVEPTAVVVFAKDEYLHSMRYAQARGVGYVSLSSGTFEIGPEVAQYLQAPGAAPVVLASHWLAGAVLFPALDLARSLRRVDELRIGVLLDEQDMGGPAAAADYDRIVGTMPSALVVEEGRYTWVAGDAARATYRRVDGVEVDATLYAPLDIVSLGAATHARTIRLDLAYTASSSTARGEHFSTEITIDARGLGIDGAPRTLRAEIVHPEGQAPLTALGIAMLTERLLGLRGERPRPGLFLPELLLTADDYLPRMRAIGTAMTVRADG